MLPSEAAGHDLDGIPEVDPETRTPLALRRRLYAATFALMEPWVARGCRRP
jgi:hypothetical protein